MRISLDDISADDQELAEIPRNIYRVSRRPFQPREYGVGLMSIHVHLRRLSNTDGRSIVASGRNKATTEKLLEAVSLKSSVTGDCKLSTTHSNPTGSRESSQSPLSYLAHDRESHPIVLVHEVGDLFPRARLLRTELVAREGNDGQPTLVILLPKGLELAVVTVRVPAIASNVHNKDSLQMVRRKCEPFYERGSCRMLDRPAGRIPW